MRRSTSAMPPIAPQVIPLARLNRPCIGSEPSASVHVMANSTKSVRLSWRAHAMPSLHDTGTDIKRERLLRKHGSTPMLVCLLRGTTASKVSRPFKMNYLGPVLEESVNWQRTIDLF